MARHALALLAPCALGASACFTPAASLTPGNVGRDKGAIVGRVEIVHKGEPVTASCRLRLTDGANRWKTAITMDATGWVFAAVERGPTQVDMVICLLGGFMTTYNALYAPPYFLFDVPGGAKTSYFGHVRIDLAPSEYKGSSLSNVDGEIHVDGRPEDARREYARRYGPEAAASLWLEASLAGKARPFARGRPPALAAGFALDRPIGAAEARCTDGGLGWRALDERRFACSGAPVDLGVPLAASVTACAGTVCAIALDASADRAPWSALVTRYARLSELLEWSHGDQRSSTTEPLADCADPVPACFAKGRARATMIWRWPTRQRVSLVLDGGPRGGAPSLRVVYTTAALAEEME